MALRSQKASSAVGFNFRDEDEASQVQRRPHGSSTATMENDQAEQRTIPARVQSPPCLSA